MHMTRLSNERDFVRPGGTGKTIVHEESGKAAAAAHAVDARRRQGGDYMAAIWPFIQEIEALGAAAGTGIAGPGPHRRP